MIKLLKVIAWFLFFASLAAFAYLALGGTHGHLTVTVNGQHVEGAQKLLIGSFGFLIAAVAMLVSLGFAALALASSGLLVFGALALTALVLIRGGHSIFTSARHSHYHRRIRSDAMPAITAIESRLNASLQRLAS